MAHPLVGAPTKTSRPADRAVGRPLSELPRCNALRRRCRRRRVVVDVRLLGVAPLLLGLAVVVAVRQFGVVVGVGVPVGAVLPLPERAAAVVMADVVVI